MNIYQLLAHIDSFAPFDLAEEWDNSGLLVGSPKAEVTKIAVTLDAIPEAVISASEQGCNVLVTHHPLIFRPLRNINTEHDIGKTISEALKRDVAIIAAHTNWDKAEEGVNMCLAKLLGLQKIKPLEEFGVYGIIPEAVNFREFLEHVKSSWGLSHLDCYAQNMPDTISRVALCGGSGAEFWRQAKAKNADIYLTADMKYHELSDSVRSGLAITLNIKALSSPIRI